MLTSPRNIPALSPNKPPKKSKEDYKFWKTQPVPDIGQFTWNGNYFHMFKSFILTILISGEVINENEPIEPDVPVSEIRTESYSLPPGFVWCDLDLNDSKQVD